MHLTNRQTLENVSGAPCRRYLQVQNFYGYTSRPVRNDIVMTKILTCLPHNPAEAGADKRAMRLQEHGASDHHVRLEDEHRLPEVRTNT